MTTTKHSPRTNNPRKITSYRLAALKDSVREFGDISGITYNVEDKQLVTGHQRVSTAESFLPVVEQVFKKPTRTGTVGRGYVEINGERFTYREVKWTKAKAEAAMLAANNHAGEWDRDGLRAILAELQESKFDMEMTGFSDAELAKLLAIPAPPADPDAPSVTDTRLDELQAKWGTKLGDVWDLGAHRIVCGDSTKLKTLAVLMGKDTAQLLYTDPPYGVSYKTAGKQRIANDELTKDALANFLIPALRLAHGYLANTGAAYIWHASSTRRDFEHALDTVGFREKQYLTWVKDGFVLGHADYHWQTEPCFYCEKAGQAANFYGDRAQSTVWRITQADPTGTFINIATGLHLTNGNGASLYLRRQPPKTAGKMRHLRVQPGQPIVVADESTTTDAWEIGRDGAEQYLHPTQKPVALAARAIQNSSKEGDKVLDLFHGAGATLVACEQLKRICRAVELDPRYVAVALERASELGMKPTKEK